MSEPGHVLTVPKPSLRAILAAPLRLQSYRNIVYLGLAFPLGLSYFVGLSVGLSLGVAFSLFLVGLPLLVAVLGGVHLLAELERLQVRYLLGQSVERPRLAVLDAEEWWDRVTGLVLDTATYRALVQLLSKLGVGVASFTLLLTGAVTSGVFLAVPVYYDRPGVHVGFFPVEPIEITSQLYVPWDSLLVGVEFAFELTGGTVDTLPEALLMSGLGVVVFVASINAANLLAWVSGEFTRVLLGRGRLRDLSLDVRW